MVLGGIFLYAAYTKLRQPWFIFAMSIDAYHIFPEWASLTIARVLPWGELVLGLMLVSGLLLRAGSMAAALLLTLFLGLMLWAYSRGMAIDCGCFGAGEALGPMTLLRDGSLLIASLVLAV